MTLQFASSCSCSRDRVLAGGGTPEYFQEPQRAAQAFLEHQQRFQVMCHFENDHRYWAVHLNGRHVIAI